MRHKIGDIVFHPNICKNGSLGEIIEIRYSNTLDEARWFGEELQYFVSWHQRVHENDGHYLSYADEDITIMKRWLYQRMLKDAT